MFFLDDQQTRFGCNFINMGIFSSPCSNSVLFRKYSITSNCQERENCHPFKSYVLSFPFSLLAVNISLSFCIGLQLYDPPRPVRDLLGILLILNSLVNPFAYAFLKSDIKRECKVLLCRKLEGGKEK